MPQRTHVQRLAERTRVLSPLAAAFVHPCDAESLQLAVAAEFAGYVAPTLVGPEARIRDAAGRAGLDISRLRVVDAADDPAASAARAIALARDGRVAALVKGAMSDGALLAPVASPETGLRTERRLSHATLVDLPGHPHALIVADDRLNIAPPLAAKRDILLSTAEFAHALGVAVPAIALVAALDAPTPAVPSTVDAAALAAMASTALAGAAVVDGPMTADVALSAESARGQGSTSPVAGRADVLIAPTMETASMIVRTLAGIGHALCAGLVLGASVPIVVAGRGDSIESRVASCVLAALASAHRRAAAPSKPVVPAPARAAA